jgi:hypothetical protein
VLQQTPELRSFDQSIRNEAFVRGIKAPAPPLER